MQNVKKKLNLFIIAALTACLLITCMPIDCHSTFSLIQNVNAASKDNVLWYNIDGDWAGFDPELKMLTWWPSESEGAVIVPDNFDGIPVTVIGEWAFYKHENITSVTLPETVEKLDEGAFSGCSALQSINGLDNVVSIGDYAFRNCSKLKDINSFKSLRSIGNKAFDGCSSLTDLVIPAASFDKPSITTNVSRNIYSDSVRADKEDWNYCSDKVGSYLYWDGQFYWRVECSGVVIVEKYTKDLEFVEGFNLETDLLKIWGGFYCGKKYNFIVTGSYNYEENDKTPVIRVDKYSKTWKKLKTLEIKNFNTVEFPRSTALRFAEYKNFLYIHSARRMYAADDGYNHQESVTLQINEKTMKLMNSTADKSRYFSGTVSHSFNQFILVDSEKNIITLDHGDASPRSIVLSKLNGKAGKGNPFSQKGTRLEIYKIPKYTGDEEWGYNMTGTSVGGLEETKTGYITAYATDGKGGNAEYDGIKNIYYTFTPKSDFSEKATVTKKITSYSGSGKTSAGTPQVVSAGTDGYIIWDIIEKGKVSGKIAYVKYDSKGKISKVKTMDGVLSDCKPIYVNGKVLWYVTDDSTPEFYSLTEVIQPNDNAKEPKQENPESEDLKNTLSKTETPDNTPEEATELTKNCAEPTAASQSTQTVTNILAGMTLKEKICQMIIVHPSELTGVAKVTAAGETTQKALEKYPVGGLIYDATNFVSIDQTKTMIENTQSYSKIPLIITLDEEGGRVNRLMHTLNTTYVGPMYDYRNEGTDKARENARTIAKDISGLGFNLDLAPVADVWSNPANKVIGNRAYSDKFKQAATLIPAAVEGFHEGGVACTLKHFPGHGDTSADSHYGAVYVYKTLKYLKKHELRPFQAGIDAGADCVMMGHLIISDVDDKPALFSKKLVTKLLRKKMGFSGVVITDALEMKAMTDHYGDRDIAVNAVKAGVDVLLMPSNLDKTIDALIDAVESGEISEKRIDESVVRILTLKEKYGLLADVK